LPSFSERWQNIVQGCNLDLENKAINFVSMQDIAKFSGRDARLMVSIGTENRQPEVFRKYSVFATPVSRTRVAIVKGKGFEKIDESKLPPVQTHKTDFAFPEYLRKSRGEANFLRYAFNCGLLTQFTSRKALRPEYSAKARTTFTFRVDGNEPLSVEGAQFELDESYGDDEMLYLVEAKYKTPKSFSIRQLYYPYRNFVPEVKPRQVKNLFFAFEPNESEFRFWEYTFTDPEDIEKIDLVGSARYKIEFAKDPISPLKKYIVAPVEHQEAIQANNVYFLMDVPFYVADGIDDTAKLANFLGVDRRQGQYYGKGSVTLGLIEKRGNKFVLTPEGEKYVGLSPDERTKFFISRLVENPPVSEALHRIIAGERLGLPELMQITAKHDERISGNTVERRARCLRSYFKLIADVMGYLVVSKGAVSLHNTRDTLDGYR
jgi:hypothetical protein